jgi:hypothetical protein
LRDGRRLCNVAGAALDLCADDVAYMDVLALEAVRVFDPDVHERLLDAADLLTGAQSPLDFRDRRQVNAEQREAADALLANSSRSEATRTILRELFPAAAHLFGGSRERTQAQWRAGKRVAAKSVLLRYLHLTLATSEVASSVVDRALASLSDSGEFAALLDTIEDARLDDLLNRVRRRLGEQPSVDAVGCALVVLGVIPRLPERRQSFDVDPPRRAAWFVQDLVENIGSMIIRADVAHRIVEQAPSLSLRASLLYRFRTPPEESDSPGLDLLEPEVFEKLRSALSREIVDAEPTEIAGETDVLWLVQLVRDVIGEEAALRRLEDRAVLRAALAKAGTRVHPLTDTGVSLHVKPLFELVGRGVVPLLQQLLADDDQLDDQLRVALQHELERYEAGGSEANEERATP